MRVLSCHSDSLDDTAADVVFTRVLVSDRYTQDDLGSYVRLDSLGHFELQSRVDLKALLKDERDVFGRDTLSFESLALGLDGHQFCQFVDIVSLGGEVDWHDELLLLLVAASALLGHG